MAQGDLLRLARTRRQMTLHDVEAVTEGEFKAASLSAYERGERAISVLRLMRIADVYKTPLEDLLPAPDTGGEYSDTGRPPRPGLVAQDVGVQRLRLDVERLVEMRGPGWDQLRNLVGAIQQRRRGRSGRYLFLRGEDIWIVGAIFGLTPREVAPMLEREGLARPT